MKPTYPHESWCPHCRVTHPPGTRRCLHCGGGVLPHRPEAGAREAARIQPFDRAGGPEPEDEDAAQLPRAARPLRIGVASLWLLLALAGAILRTCAERG
jgi:hypothetical protein